MPKIKRKDIVSRLIEKPKSNLRAFWAKEMTLFKKLESKYPLEFLNVLRFPNQFDSLAIFLSGPLAKELESRYYQYNYKPRETTPKKVDFNAEKYGEDVTIASKPKTIKDFLNE